MVATDMAKPMFCVVSPSASGAGNGGIHANDVTTRIQQGSPEFPGLIAASV